jgi:hypothetical protein
MEPEELFIEKALETACVASKKQTLVKRVLTEVEETPTFKGDPVGIERVS